MTGKRKMSKGEKLWLSILALILVVTVGWAWQSKHREKLERLYGEGRLDEWLASGGDPNTIRKSNGPLLTHALIRGDEVKVIFLLEAGADPNLKGGHMFSPTEIAARHGSLEMLQACLDKGGVLDPNVSPQGFHLLGARIESEPEDKRVARFLLDLGADPNETTLRPEAPFGPGEPLLHAAIKRGDAEMVRILCEYGADVNAPSVELGYTPLHVVIHKDKPVEGAIDKIKVLMEFGAKLGVKDQFSETPLEHAQDRSEVTGDPEIKKIADYLESLQNR